ncbi:MAG: SDR family oxidoreductase [Bdellovibrionota bacterium]
MDLGLRNETAVIFGAAGAIGSAIAEAFLKEGACAACVDLEAPRLLDASDKSAAFACDASNLQAVETVFSKITARFGAIHHVVYAAGIGSGKIGFPFLNVEPASWEKVFRVNVFGAVNVAHTAAPLLMEQRSGSILFISSVAGQIGSQTDPPYSASKAALINFAQCMAKDLAPYTVRVNSLCPGMVDSPLMRSIYEAADAQKPDAAKQDFDTWAAEKLNKVVPLGRFQSAEEIGAMSVFLASHAGQNITGQTVNVDGGYVMHW